jgi:hypothetical protein
MSIQKKSLISSLNATKKAIVASTPAADAVEAPEAPKAGVKLASRRLAMKMAQRRLSKRMATRLS